MKAEVLENTLKLLAIYKRTQDPKVYVIVEGLLQALLDDMYEDDAEEAGGTGTPLPKTGLYITCKEDAYDSTVCRALEFMDNDTSSHEVFTCRSDCCVQDKGNGQKH